MDATAEDIQLAQTLTTFAGGRYRLVRMLGAGGQKVVYLVHDNELDRDCALSLLRPDSSAMEGAADRLRNEARAIARLGSHPHVVTVFDIGVHEGALFVVSEHLAAGDLATALHDAGGCLPIDHAIDVTRQLLGALAFVHSRGIVHRDVKPDNVWLMPDGTAKLGDFGIALAMRGPGEGGVAGTPLYMAPEQLRGDPLDGRCDLYALGCLLHELLTGSPPFVGPTARVMSAHLLDPPPSLTSVLPEEPHLEMVLQRLLAKSPDERPISAEAVMAMLDDVAQHHPAARAPRGRRLDPSECVTATRALLLTDVVDSTKIASQLGDSRAAELSMAHDRLARDLLVSHAGREIDKSDGFLLLFDDASSAVAYALAYHTGVQALGLSARAGVHVGTVLLRENSPSDVARGAKSLEVEGIAKPIAARVMALAVGGQTLLTSQARAALGATSPRVASHGYWRIKGIDEPIEVFEVGDASAPFTPPPDGIKAYRVVRQGDVWLPAHSVKHSLPAERDAFVGRATDLQALAQRLDDGARLVSIFGPGGTGKTRLVTRYGWMWLGDWPGGVWFCDLCEARDLGGIVSSVARALDVPLGAQDAVEQLGHSIAGRGQCLVILDNCEQIRRDIGQTLGRWLDRAPEARFVTTTREVIDLVGEHTFALSTLVPDEAAALFVRRAQASRRDFEPSTEDVESIRGLVELLDRLPLAIELAASRVRMMSPRMLLARMDQRFELLSSTSGRHDRQATLRATLDWSWDLLSEGEQSALAQLSVFEGGFTLEALEAVVDVPGAWPPDVLQGLIDKSLVRRVADDRHGLLVSVHEYAALRLTERGNREVSEARHGAWYARFGDAPSIAALRQRGGDERLELLARDLDNLVAACERAIIRADRATAVASLVATCEVLFVRGPALRGVEIAERVLAIPGLDDRERWRVVYALSEALCIAGRGDEARAQAEIARDLTRRIGDRGAESEALNQLARVCCVTGVPLEQGRRHATDALEMARALGDRQREALGHSILAATFAEEGRLEEGRTHLDAAIALARDIGDRRTEGTAMGNLGLVDILQGRLADARDHLEAALIVHRARGNRPGEGSTLINLVVLALRTGALDDARGYIDVALAAARDVGDRRLESHCAGALGELELRLGRLAEARAAFIQAEVILRTSGGRVDLAKLLCLRSICEYRDGRAEAARAALSEAEEVLVTVGVAMDSELGGHLEHARQVVRGEDV